MLPQLKTMITTLRSLDNPVTSNALRESLRRVLIMFAGVFSVLPCHALSTHGAGIDDKGAFFSDKAKSEASAVVTRSAVKWRRDLRLETFPEIPASVREGVNLQDKAAATQMYEKWARREATNRKVNGVYVLLVKNPSHLQVVVNEETLQKAFTLADREALVTLMLGRLREKKFDEALLDGVRFFSNQMSRHASEKPLSAVDSPSSNSNFFASKTSGFGWLGSLLIAVLVITVILRLLGAVFGAMTGSSPGLGGVPSGGGFFRSLMGGLFGAAAGMWLYDHFFGHSGGTSAWGSSEGTESGAPFGEGPKEFSESDYSGSGGDFGDNSSDSDSGGSFDSGGDFGSGGGDFGD